MRTVGQVNLLTLLLHSVRIRILHAFSGGRTCTTSELCARLPDVSQATIYRHVALLVRGGVLQNVGERPKRGAVERSYRLDTKRAIIDEDAAGGMDREMHRRAFAAAIAALLADFGTYIDHLNAAPSSDLVGYRQLPLWLSPQELRTLMENLRGILEPVLANRPETGRRQYMLSPIFFPIVESDVVARIPQEQVRSAARSTRRPRSRKT